LRVISEEEMEERTVALTKAVPERKREVVAQQIRQYAEDMDRRYSELAGCLQKQLGKKAAVVLKEMNKPDFEWDRDVAARIEGKTSE